MGTPAGSEEEDTNPSDEPRFPKDPEFYRRVLHFMPTPLAVVNDSGELVYLNQALLALGGWKTEDDVGLDFLSYIHPEDRGMLAESFVDIVQSPEARMLGGGPWAEMSFRIIAVDGTTLPVEIVGSGGLLDETVGGMIYEVRPAHTRVLLSRVLDGLSRGASMLQLLSLVVEMITSPPLDLDAVIFQTTPHGDFILAASTSLELSELLRGSHVGAPWENLTKEPSLIDPAKLPESLRERLAQSRFHNVWHVSVESPLTGDTLRIITASPTHNSQSIGPKNRLERARELAAAVLLRTQADVLLDHAAHRDALTDLPNRAAFFQLAESLDPTVERGALHLDLDGLKPVNDTYGAACGDAVLRIVADRLRVAGSASDIIGRIGDDEFAILLTPASEDEPVMDRAVRLASEVLEAVSDPIVVAGRPLHMSASIGVAVVPPGMSTDHLITWADAAMHDAKAAGGGQISRFGVAII